MRLQLPAYAFVASLLLIACTGSTKEVDLGGERICFPSYYSPNLSLTIWLMTRGSPDPGDEVRIYLPAHEIEEHIPGYSLSHANQYNPAVPHDINGLAYPAASHYQKRVDLAEEAWRVSEGGYEFFVVQDEENGFWRIYRHRNPSFMWHMVASPPPVPFDGSPPPSDWYIGHCLEKLGGYACRQSVRYGPIVYEYKIDKRNLHLRDSVATLLTERLKEWIDACEA